MIKVNYDPQTTLVLGKYPSTLYQNAPEPNIEISDSEYVRIFGAGLFMQPCVINGVIQEFQKPVDELLQDAKVKKLAELEINVINYRYKNITINSIEYIASAKAIDNLAKARRLMEDQGLTSVDWLDANNNLVTMTISLVLQINLLSFQQQSNSYLQSVVISGQINSASSLEELDQININL